MQYLKYLNMRQTLPLKLHRYKLNVIQYHWSTNFKQVGTHVVVFFSKSVWRRLFIISKNIKKEPGNKMSTLNKIGDAFTKFQRLSSF